MSKGISKYVSSFYQHVILEKQNHWRLFSIAIDEMEQISVFYIPQFSYDYDSGIKPKHHHITLLPMIKNQKGTL